MASNINPANINGAYPVAGQDNDSQGFRDNFTNIKSNLTFAQEEISNLQLNSVTLGVENDLATTTLKNPILWGATEKVAHLGAKIGAVTIDVSAGDYQDLEATGNISLAFSNWPVTGKYSTLRVLCSDMTSGKTITFPAAVAYGLDNMPGVSGQVLTPPVSGDYLFEFSTDIAGSGTGSVAVRMLNAPVGADEPAEAALKANVTILQGNVTTLTSNVSTLQGNIVTLTSMVYTGSEDLADAAAASLTKTLSYFTTGAAETATLAASVTDGLIKTFLAVNVAAGNMVVTVTNPAWGGAGTLTFATAGSSVTLQYALSAAKWFVIANNGATIA